MEHKYGNLKETPLEELFMSPKHKEVLEHAWGTICAQCTSAIWEDQFPYVTNFICYKCMIKDIIDLLQVSDFYKESEDIDIAKGKYQIPLSWKEVRNMFKRM